MPLAKDLMGAGIPSVPALFLGYQLGAITAAGTASTTATALATTNLAIVTTASSQTGVILPSDSVAPLGVPYLVYTASSDTGKLFPPSGGTINGGTATTGAVDFAQNKPRIAWRVGTLTWVSIYTA